jgi:hypothetical protein
VEPTPTNVVRNSAVELKGEMEREELLSLLSRWAELGTETLPSGSVYIGRPIPAVGKGFFHRVYAPAPVTALANFLSENALMTKFSYCDNLKEYNGFNLFYRSFYLYGVHGGQVSSLDLPFDILIANIEEWGRLSGPETLLIGGADFGNRSINFIERADGKVLAVENGARLTFEWDSLCNFIRFETSRLSKFFNLEGELIADIESSSFGDDLTKKS